MWIVVGIEGGAWGLMRTVGMTVEQHPETFLFYRMAVFYATVLNAAGDQPSKRGVDLRAVMR